MHFSLKQALTWLVLFICAGLIINGLYERTEDNNNKSETLVATDWKVIKTNIGGSTYSEEDDDYEIGDDIHLNVKVSFDLNGGEMSSDFGNSKIVSTNEKYGALPTPHRKGYNFEGWYTKVTGGTKITQDSIVKINRNHTLFAHWNPIQYNLAYYHNNTLLGSYAHLYNQDITIKNYTDFQISKRGYTFKGWLDDADVLHEAGSVVSRLTEKENSTFKLRSEWTPNVYNVHFDPNGGVTPQESKKVTFDSAYGTLPTPTRQYYTFTGWYTEKDGGAKVTEKDIYQIDGDTTLYAHWVQNTYTITFIVGDKTFVVTAFEGEEVQEPDTTKQGYTFTGWYTKASGGTKVTDFGYKTQTVYAQWKANNYLLTFNPNGGSVTPATKQVTYDSKYGTLPTPVKTGYTFKGWHLPDGTKIDSNDIVQILEDTTVTASWQANVYTVNFYNGTTKIGSKQYTYDQQGDLPLFKTFNVNKTGYTFKGWGVNASQTTPTYQDGQRILNLSAINNSTVNLYTVWQANKYTVTYISDGQVYGNSQFTYDKEARLTTAKDLSLTKQGYTFQGWAITENGTVKYGDGATVKNLTPTSDGNVNLYAVWKANNYTIKYYSEGKIVGDSLHVYDTASNLKTIRELGLSKTGYTFQGWATSSNSSTVVYKDGQSVKNLSTGGTVNLFAVWKANSYTITLNPNGGTVNPTTLTVTYDAPYGTLPTPSRTGYTFIGWYLGNTQITKDSIVRITSDSTLVAKWSANKYTVTFDPVGGTLETTSKTVTYDAPYGILPTPSKTGYGFEGWYLNGTQITSNSVVKITSNVTLTAKWSANKYTIEYYNAGVKVGSSAHAFNAAQNLKTDTQLNISKTGYSLAGWSTSSTSNTVAYKNGEQVINLTTTNNAVIKLYAIWSPNTYTVTFDPNGGTGGPTIQNFIFNRGDKLTTSIPSRKGYTFTHWQRSDNANYTFKPGDVIPNGWLSFKLSAQWEANTYNVEYYNGTTKVGTSAHTYDVAKTLTTASTLKLSKTGYSFAGWTTTSGSSTANYKDGASVANLTPTNNGTVKLYAVWQANQYTVTFNPNGGSVNPASKTVAYNSTYGTLPTPTRAGYNFAGWYLNDAQIITGSKVTTASNHTLIAKWTQLQNTKYTVKHYLMNVNGVGYTLKETQGLQGPTDNSIIIKDHAKSFTGFSYASCKLDGSSTDTTSTTTTIKGDGSRVLNLYYTRNKYTITVSKGTGINTVTNSITQYYQSNASVTATISTGYHWSKWNSSNTNILPSSTNQTYSFTVPASNVTLTAIAEANTYTVTYNANGGTGGPTTQSFKFNSGAKPSTSIPSRTGYTFVHWQFTGNPNYTFQPGAAIPSGWGSFTLEAIWQANTQSITINPNGGTYLGGGTKTITGKTDELKPIVKPLKPGYTFNKWTLSGGGSLNYYGLQLKNSQAFSTGTDGLVVYNNSGNGNVTHARVPATSDNPMGSSYQMNITNKGASSPGLGGFHTATPSKANGSFYHVFVAKAPKGSTLNQASNAVGTGSKFTWLTPNKGTGNFETYIYKLQCGSSGTFSTFGHIYLTGATSPVTWQVAYSNIFDATGGLTRANTDTVLKVGSGASTLTATWTANNYNVEYYNGSTKVGSAVHTYDVGKNLTPASVLGLSKTGYTFAGWSTKSGSTTAQYTDNQSVKNLTTTSGGTVKLYAVWKANPETTFTVKHYLMNTDGSTYALNNTLSYKGQTDSSITLSNYRKSFTGFTYKETRLDGSSTPTSGNTTTIAPNGSRVINIYYSRNKYQITVGKGTGIASTTNTFTAYYGTSQKVTATVSTGYHWGKWDSLNDALLADSANQTYTFTMPAGNVTINATAVANTYTIRYYNGPTLLGSSTHTYNASKLLTSGASLKAVKAGYDFVGWDTSNAGAIVRLDDEQSVLNLTSTNGGTVNVYAVFSDIGKQITTVQNKMNYPIGMVIQTPTATNPSSVYGGQWQQIASGRTLVGVNESNSNFNTVKKTGGTMTETLTINQMPRHNHNGSTNNTGSHSHAFHSNASPTYGVAYYINNGSYNYVPTKHSQNHIKLGHISLGTDGTHSHSFTTSNTGGGASHDNMQPYYGVYIWEKIGN